MQKKEFKIGEVFQCGLVKLKCEKEIDEEALCRKCFFYRNEEYFCNDITKEISGECDMNYRLDNQGVIFVKVEE